MNLENIKLSGAEAFIPGTNLLMKLRLGTESDADYQRRRQVCLEAMRHGTIIYKIGDPMDMYYIDVYKNDKKIGTINGHPFYSGNTCIEEKNFDSFKIYGDSGEFEVIVKISHRGHAMNSGHSFRYTEKEIFRGNLKSFA